ncbi:MAG TPA: DoxX family protein [Candidatus Cybelea sp.]|nr:DoxX family protein [Candidatus Cybelea sp.]
MLESLRFMPLLGRILIAVLFLPSGFEKVTKFQANIDYTAQHGLPVPAGAVGIAIVIELLGGLLLLVGYQTRLVAAIIAFYCLVAAFGFHHNFSDANEQIHFMKDLAIAGGLMQIVYFGAGPMSVDARAR